MKDLIEALTIFNKYCDNDNKHITSCEHDIFYVMIDPKIVSEEDINRLKDLGFIESMDDYNFYSYRYGSC
jgi:DNA-binding protein YbaB